MNLPKYDYAIIGAGAAGLQLALRMIRDDYFKEKKILILEKDEKNTNDRTWSFWEVGETHWDQLITRSWKSGVFRSTEKNILFELDPYRYKTIRSADFYAYAKAEFSKSENIEWIRDEVTGISTQEIVGQKQSYSASHIFDSRVPEEYQEDCSKHHSLIQHFKGWFIRTETPVFDPERFTIMDYRLKWKDHTSFTYVLPFSPDFALVEFTLFNNELLKENEYDHFIRNYIKEHLNIKNFSISEIEQGKIPMSDYPFHKHHTKHVTKIGTGGGWVRPSSGYSFKNAERYSAMLVNNIKKDRKPSKGIARSRFRIYDSVFLNVLSSRNDLGEKIFTRLYTKPSIQSICKFLDEESSFFQDVEVMSSLNKPQFWKAYLATFFSLDLASDSKTKDHHIF